jgi:hypothetical protein
MQSFKNSKIYLSLTRSHAYLSYIVVSEKAINMSRKDQTQRQTMMRKKMSNKKRKKIND